MSNPEMTRRAALGLTGAVLAGCTLARGEPAPGRESIAGRVWQPPHRLPPAHELANSLEFEDQARHLLAPELYEAIAGGDREPFNRMTFQVRTNIPTLDMDLTTPLFGEPLFTPIVVGPISDLGLYHPEGELAALRGAEAADTVVVVSSRSSVPFERIARSATGPVWFGVYADREGVQQARQAASAGAKVVFVTVGATYQGPGRPPRLDSGAPRVDWRAIDSIRAGVDVPVVLKGVVTPEDAVAAYERDLAGVVVSTHGRYGGAVTTMDALGPIVEVIGRRIPVLVDGSFRRGSDVLKALILGADAVLLGRPVAWALAAYGADGVQSMLEKIQEELARDFAMVGASTPDRLTRSLVRIHTRATA
jgi:4-hydroxymandelate oxidase